MTRFKRSIPLIDQNNADALCLVPAVGDCNPIEWKAAIYLARYTGARLPEILSLSGDQVGKKNPMTITLQNYKVYNRRETEREIPVPTKAQSHLVRVVDFHKSYPLFPSLNYPKIYCSSVSGELQTFFANRWRREANKVVPGVSFFHWRHYFSSALLNVFFDEEMRDRIMGRTSSDRSKFDKNTIEYMFAAMEKIP